MDDSKISTPSASTSTGKTEKSFTPDEALQILHKALEICQAAGVPVHVAQIYEEGTRSTGIILKQTSIQGRQLVYTGNPA